MDGDGDGDTNDDNGQRIYWYIVLVINFLVLFLMSS